MTWWLEVNKNAGPYYLFTHLISLLILPFCWHLDLSRRFQIGFLVFALAAYQGLPLLPFLVERIEPVTVAPSRGLTMLFANLQQDNPNPDVAVDFVKDNPAQVVALVEVDDHWLQLLKTVTADYPFKILRPRDDKYGIAVFSKLPFETQRPSDFFGDDTSVASFVLLDNRDGNDERRIEVMAFHAAPPVSQVALVENRILYRRISTFLRHATQPTVVLGDFNATPYSPFYKRMVDGASLKNAMYGRGFPRSWNATDFLQRFMIDHILYKGDLRVDKISYLPVSDHFGISVSLSMPNKKIG